MREVRVRYIGPHGGRNHDVALATKSSAVMGRGRTYRVPHELAIRLLVTRDFESAPPAHAGKQKED